jgi:hypothetical protein
MQASYDDERQQHQYRIELATTPQPFGGRRWWFVCPRRGTRVSKLYKPAGATRFASRPCWQHESPSDRATSQVFKLRRGLGNHDGLGEQVGKPKWMRWATYDRLMMRLEHKEDEAFADVMILMQKLLASRLRSCSIDTMESAC